MNAGRIILSLSIVIAALLILGFLYLSNQSFSPANPSWDGISGITDAKNVRLLSGFDGLRQASQGDTLLLIGPTANFSMSDSRQVSDFMLRGGRLVLMDDYGTGNNLLTAIDMPVIIGRSPLCQDLDYYKRPALPIVRSSSGEGIMANVGSLALNHPTSLQITGTARVLARTSGKAWLDLDGNSLINGNETFASFPVMVSMDYGPGELIVVSDSDPLINSMLDLGDNSALLSNVLSTDGTVFVDMSHGQSVPPLASLYFFIKDSAVAQAVTALILICLVYLCLGRDRILARFRKKHPPADQIMSEKERLLALMRRQPLTDREMRELNKKL